jgi:DNA-binding MarR family transcriptional regulator
MKERSAPLSDKLNDNRRDLDIAKLILEIIPTSMRMIRTEIRKVAGDLTTPQYRILQHISHTPAGNREIAEWLGVSAPTVSKMIDKLVARGLVQRKSDKENEDRRHVSLRTTSKGQQKVHEVHKTVQKLLSIQLARLSKNKKHDLVAGLEALRDYIE